MRHITIAGFFAIAAASIAICVPARADVTPEDALALQSRLRDWLASAAKPGSPPPEHPIEVKAAGDHFAVTSFMNPTAPAGFKMTPLGAPPLVDIKPIDANRWAILDGHFYAGAHTEALPDKQTPFKTYDMTVGGDTLKGVIDPTLATASMVDQTAKGIVLTIVTDSGTQIVRFDNVMGHMTMTPMTGGKQTGEANFVYDKITGALQLPGSQPATIGAGQLSFALRADGIVPSEAFPALHAFQTLMPLLGPQPGVTPAAGAPAKGIPPEARPAAHALLMAASNLVSGYDQTIALRQFQFAGSGRSISIDRISIGLGGSSAGGKLAMHMPVVIDGLKISDLPSTFWRTYQPRHIAFTPRASGMPVAALTDLISHAIDQDSASDPKNEQMLKDAVAKSPPEVGFDDIALEMGTAKLTGSFSMLATFSNNIVAHAAIRFVGYDTVLADINSHPEMKQAGAMMIFAKGLAKPDGNALVWNISFENKKLLVNGNDMSAMVPK
jgi:hypothetical protein